MRGVAGNFFEGAENWIFFGGAEGLWTLTCSSDESPQQANFFYRICDSGTQIINEIVNESEIQER